MLKSNLMLDTALGARNPEIWAIERLTRVAGIEATPSLAIGLAGGAGFVGTVVKGSRRASSRLHLSGWNSFQSDVVGAIDRLGMVAAFDESAKARGAAAALEAALAEYGTAAVWVDGAALGLGTGAGADLELPPEPMVVLVSAVSTGDLEVAAPGDVVMLVDRSTLAVARSRIPAQRNRLLAVQAPSESMPAAVRGGLATMAVGSIGGPRGRTGPEGVRRLARAIDGRGFGDWRTSFDGGWPLLAALMTFASTIRQEQGLLRHAQATFERHAAGVLGITELTAVAEAHDRLAAAWLAAADLAVPSALPALAAAADATGPGTVVSGVDPGALAARYSGTFPLSRAELDQILRSLAEAVTRLAADEHDALELLRSTLRTH